MCDEFAFYLITAPLHFGAAHAIANELLKNIRLKLGDIRRVIKVAKPYDSPSLGQRRPVLLKQSPPIWEAEARRQLDYFTPERAKEARRFFRTLVEDELGDLKALAQRHQ